jgi:hypothetical protein
VYVYLSFSHFQSSKCPSKEPKRHYFIALSRG